MRHRLSLACSVAAGLTIGLTSVAAGPAMATIHGMAAHTALAHVPAEATQPATQPLLLINGSRVQVGQAGGVTVLPGSLRGGLATSMQSFTASGQTYEVPVDAVPYFGRGLDPSLFQVSTLQKVERDGRLPVQIGYRGRVPALPGVTITHSSGGQAQGYLTESSASRFGAALERQFVTDHTGASYGTDGLFGAGTTISLVGTAARPAAKARTGAATRVPSVSVHPRYPMHTLTVDGTNAEGKPDTGDGVWLLNLDDPCRFCGLNTESVFYHGVAKFSVPNGHYFAFADFDVMDGSTLQSERIVTLPQFTVSGNATVQLAASSAEPVTMVTPRPATIQDTTVQLLRIVPFGTEFAWHGWSWEASVPLWMNPVSGKPSIGQISTIPAQVLTSPAGTSSPYRYLATHLSNGAFNPSYVVPAKSLATVATKYYQDVPANATAIAYAPYPDTAALLPYDLVYPIQLPMQETEYLTTGPSLVWFRGYAVDYSQDSGQLSGPGQADTGVLYQAGEQTSDDWNAFPLHTAPETVSPAAAKAANDDNQFISPVSASRSVNTLSIDMHPFSDNEFGHGGDGVNVGPGGTLTGSYEIDQNGAKVAGGTLKAGSGGGWPDFGAQANLSKNPSTVTLNLGITRAGSAYNLSTSDQTTWTWHSVAVPASKQLPGDGFFCASSLLNVPTTNCAVEPLMTLGYAVAGMALNGTTSPGSQKLTVTVGHLQLTPATKITGVTVQVSSDGGKTWQNATVTGSGGTYQASYTAPAGSDVTLRTSATDAAGGQITDTITNAYAIAGSSAAARATTTAASYRPAGPALGRQRAACPAAPAEGARCFALYAPQQRVDAAIAARAAGQRVPVAATTPGGLGANNIESAYKLPVSKTSNQTVALVDAYSTPKLASDLAAYRNQYGLPACTTASGCLRIVNQQGQSSPLPKADPQGWGVEESLDVDMVSAACPHCKILMVEANSQSFANLAKAEDTAASMGATVISNSYGAPETGFTQTQAKSYDHPGHVIVVASGDEGFGPANFPANLATVTAVGGTQLTQASNPRGWTEAVWKDVGDASASGCSAYVAKPSWQDSPHCPGRTVADVSAVASDVAIYDSSLPKLDGGPWFTIGGTSAASPLIAGVYGLAGNAATLQPGSEYANPGDLFDITTGNNVTPFGTTCGTDYLCNAKKGYDAPTGLGTPDGIGDF